MLQDGADCMRDRVRCSTHATFCTSIQQHSAALQAVGIQQTYSLIHENIFPPSRADPLPMLPFCADLSTHTMSTSPPKSHHRLIHSIIKSSLLIITILSLIYLFTRFASTWISHPFAPKLLSEAQLNDLAAEIPHFGAIRAARLDNLDKTTSITSLFTAFFSFFVYSYEEFSMFVTERILRRNLENYYSVPVAFRSRMRAFDPKEGFTQSNVRQLYLVHVSGAERRKVRDSVMRSELHAGSIPVLSPHLYLMTASQMEEFCLTSTCKYAHYTLSDKTKLFSAHLSKAPKMLTTPPSDINLSNMRFSIKFTKLTPQLEQLLAQYPDNLQQVTSNTLHLSSSDHTQSWSLFSTLLSHPNVYHISHALHRYNSLHNYAANKIIQNGYTMSHSSQTPAHNRTHIWNKGIRGVDQIAAISDTGIDYDNCFFSRSVEDPSLQPDTRDATHRKIIYYQRMRVMDSGKMYESDSQDMASGHGSHTAGSIAGSILTNHQNYEALHKHNGVAPDAKLYFQDIHNPKYPFLLIPAPLDGLFTPAYKAGARVHSNSWGCDFSSQFSCQIDCKCVWNPGNSQGKPPGTEISNSFCESWFGRRCCSLCAVYDDQAAEVDDFLHKYDDMSIVFAAGNLGSSSVKGNIVTPGSNKNGITVGASMSLNEGFVLSVNATDFQTIFDQLRSLTDGAIDFSSTQECCSYRGNQDSLIHEICCPQVIRAIYTQNPDVYASHNLAPFSGRGPVPQDDRFGVDVVAPGMPVISMHSDGDVTTNNCGTMSPELANRAAVMESQGTSMSTPLVAGAALLVRDYYARGYYPGGSQFSGSAIDPSGMLVKATILHSAQPIQGRMFLGSGYVLPLSRQYPNAEVGFGQVQLDSALKFDDSNFDMFVVNRREIDEGERHSFCFSPRQGVDARITNSEFRATLVWFDLEGDDSGISDRTLINNLELNAWIVSQDEQIYYPGNGNHYHDSANTAEQVRIVQLPQARIIVTVEGISQVKTQNYALIITYSKHLNMEEGCEAPPRPRAPWNLTAVLFFVLVIGGALVIAAASVGGVILVAVGLWKHHMKSRGVLEMDGDAPNQPQSQPWRERLSQAWNRFRGVLRREPAESNAVGAQTNERQYDDDEDSIGADL